MKIKMWHTDIGEGVLTTGHPASSYGQPVFVTDDGEVYGPGDKFPRYGCNVGYLQKADVDYSQEQIDWIDDYIVKTHVLKPPHRWEFGATWKNKLQLEKIEASGKKIIRNT